MLFVLGKNNENKIEICKMILFLKDTEARSLKNISEQLTVTTVTVRNLIKEINEDFLGNLLIEIRNNMVSLKESKFSIEEIVSFYCLNDIGFKTLESLLIRTNVYTVHRLAQTLFVSIPQVYRIIKSLNEHLVPYRISIILDEVIQLKGTEKSIKNLFYELISLSNNLSENLYMFPKKSLLRRQVNIIFGQYSIISSSFNTICFGNWILTCLNWRYILRKRNIIIIEEKGCECYPFFLDEEFMEIGNTVMKNLGQKNSSEKEIKELYLGFANLVLKFTSPTDALFFQDKFIDHHSINYKLKAFVTSVKKLIVDTGHQEDKLFPIDSYVLFILNYIPYFFVSWKKNLDLHQYVYGVTPANYEKMDHLCTNYLSIDDDFVKDVYIRHFCVMIEYYNLCNANDVLTNKKFVYESVLGMDTENIMLAKIISLFDISDDHFDHNLEYVHIVDDIRLIKDPHKKYILLQDFLNYINDLF